MCAAAMERRVGSSHGRAAKIEQREKGPLAVWVTYTADNSLLRGSDNSF